MSDELDDAIEQAAQDPKRAKGDMGEVEAHPLGDQVEAAKYLAGKAEVKKRNRGLRFNKFVPPGAD